VTKHSVVMIGRFTADAYNDAIGSLSVG